MDFKDKVDAILEMMANKKVKRIERDKKGYESRSFEENYVREDDLKANLLLDLAMKKFNNSILQEDVKQKINELISINKAYLSKVKLYNKEIIGKISAHVLKLIAKIIVKLGMSDFEKEENGFYSCHNPGDAIEDLRNFAIALFYDLDEDFIDSILSFYHTYRWMDCSGKMAQLRELAIEAMNIEIERQIREKYDNGHYFKIDEYGYKEYNQDVLKYTDTLNLKSRKFISYSNISYVKLSFI